MRHLRKTKDKFSETKGYLLAVGILIKALDIIKSVLLLMWVHSNGIIAAFTFVCVCIAYSAMGNGALNYNLCIYFIGILLTLLVAMIKIMIEEHKERKKKTAERAGTQADKRKSLN